MAKNKTPKQVRAMWAKALRSGAYQQTKGWLHNRAGYCCLGVLCDLAVKEGVIPKPVLKSFGHYSYSQRDDALPLIVQAWAGLETAEGDYQLKSGRRFSLVNDNDERGKSFKEIAAVITREPKSLVTT